MKIKIRLDTQTEVYNLVGLATGLSESVYLTDGANVRVSAKAILGTMYAKFDFSEIWLETENEHYYLFKDFVVEE